MDYQLSELEHLISAKFEKPHSILTVWWNHRREEMEASSGINHLGSFRIPQKS